MIHRKIGHFAAAFFFAAVAAPAQTDPPARVARLDYLCGAVSFRPGSVEDWSAATLNYPLTTGDHLWADAGSRAEMRLGSAAVRMGPQTALAILNLDDRMVQLSLTEGSLNVHIRYLDPDDAFEVDTPNAAVSLLRPGDYRFQVDGDRNLSVVTVRGGEAEVTGGGTAFSIHAMETAHLSGVDALTRDVAPALSPDEFDRWCAARDRGEESVISARYVPREMIGYEDLDANGAWREIPPYGWVWTPTAVPPGWAPYRYGHWAWVEPWGWTWIDDAPWGFAPFHYGRWAYAGGVWAWVPGRMMAGVRPVYAPALVAFVGGVSVAVGGGVAAWFPLGPNEVYRPAYRVSEAYVRQINMVHVTDVTVINRVDVTRVRYVNQGVAGAVTVVPHEAFVTARPVAQAAVRVDVREAANAPVIGTTAAVPPRRESIAAGPARGAVPPARVAERRVVTKTAPPPPPVSFAAKRQALENNGGRPLDPGALDALRRNEPARGAGGSVERSVTPPRNDRPPAPGRTENAPSRGATDSRTQPASERSVRINPEPAGRGGIAPSPATEEHKAKPAAKKSTARRD